MSKMRTAIPAILLGFFVMGFVDVVGISTSYVKADFDLPDALASMLPMAVFLWFFVFSIPTGMLMNKWGKKQVVAASMAVTAVAMVIPMVSYSFATMMISFAMLGIGNTMLQVSLNPLAASTVRQEMQASILTWGQFIKAISSFLGPILAGAAALYTGQWRMIFAIYAAVTLISLIYVWFSANGDKEPVEAAGFGSTLKLFGDAYIVRLFVGILVIVGIDVGLNTVIPKLLVEKTGMELSRAGLGTSLYFVARTAGTFVGAIALAKCNARSIMRGTMAVAIAAMLVLMIAKSQWALWASIAVVGMMYANVFSIIFAYALQHRPEQTNQVSSLMIMGVSGGALFAPIMGLIADNSTQAVSMCVVLLGTIYLLLFISNRRKD